MNSPPPIRSRAALAWLLVLALKLPLLAQVPDPIMPLSAVKPGMKGVGRTVWSGTRIETFDVTVISVMKNFEPKRDIILTRLSGPAIERYGVVAGMSGSPVYIDGKVIGAVSLGWPFQKEAIAGVTPIEEMQAIMRLSQPEHPGAPAGWRPPAGGPAPAPEGRASPLGLTPIRTPLLLSGVPADTLKRLESRFAAHNLVPIQGGAGAGILEPPSSDELKPGGAVGVSLVSGDLSMDAVGTLTWRDGDRFVAFGHPFMGLGDCALPIAPAIVHSVMPSLYVSFKLAAAGAPVGSMRQDRPPGVLGHIGKPAVQFPVSIDITPNERDPVKPYRFKVSQVGPLTPLVLMTLTDSVITANGRVAGEQSFVTRLELKLAGRAPLTYQNMFSTREDHLAAVIEMLSPALHLLTNKFEPVVIEGVKLEIEAQERTRDARIESVRLDKVELERGETAEAAVILRTYGGAREAVRVKFTVPMDAAAGPAQLFACDAQAGRARAAARNPGRYAPTSLEGVINLGREERRNNEVVLQLMLARDGVTYTGQELPRLPASALSIISASGLSGFKSLQSEVEVRQPTRHAVQGAETLEVRIREQKQP